MEQFYGGEMDHGVAAVPVFDPMDREDDTVGVDHNLLDDDGPLSFYATDFPPVPDFPCMSSSSSSSSTRAPVKATSSSSPSSSSSAASWAVLKSDQDADRSPQLQQPAPPLPALSSTASMDMIPSEIFMLEDAPRKEEEEVGLEDCLEMMETFGYMDLLECNDLFDPSSIFQNEEPTDPTATNNGYPVEEFQAQHYLPQEQPQQNFQQDEGAGAHHGHPASAVQPCEQQEQLPVVVLREAADEMGQVLLEWLRTNRDNISAEDLRRVKIKKATIESAAQRLGGGKAAMKQLLKLILEWVQTNHLHRKRKEAAEAQNNLTYSPFQDMPDPGSFPNPNPNILNSSTNSSFPSEPASCFPQSTQWPSPYGTEHAGSLMAAHPTFTPSAVGYMGGDLFSGSGDLYSVTPGLADYHMLDSPQSSWLLPQFGPASTHYNFMTADANFQPQASQAFVGYGNNSQYSNFQQQYYSSGNGERSLMRPGSSATKEARKKRMARQRRLMTHHRSGSGHHIGHHASHQNGHHQAVMAMDHQQHARALGGCDQVAAAAANPGNWVYFPAQTPAVAPPAPPPLLPPEAMQVHQPVDRQPASMHGQCSQRGQVAPDRRQGWKPENNLKFLLQKVLKQSDVGNLGRIVLPKKEAETHLPELEARDGISISMEDIGTSRVWNMRYRFWPNNKSRMYLLENTGDFVRANGLQEGDFIVIYSDVKCGKYLIRGVKVRQTEAGAKSDPKRQDNSKPPRNSCLQGSSSTAASNAALSK